MATRDADALSSLGTGLAHALRNPLNSALLELALAQRKLARDHHPVPGEIAEATHELLRAATLLEDFLAFALPHPTTFRCVDLATLIAHVLDDGLRDRAKHADVTLIVSGGPEIIAEVDPKRMSRAIVEVIANAIDAARATGDHQVVVRWNLAGSEAVVEVVDHGLGPGNAPVFDPFYTTKPAGTGLGLAIVDRVVVDHGGSAELVRVGESTVFRLRLPAMC